MLLEVEGVEKHFDGVAALAGASLGVAEGEIVGIVGPNGSGKSTLLNAMSGFMRPDAGCVRFDGHAVECCQPWEISAYGMRRTFQLARLPERMSVMEVMLAGAHLPTGASALGCLLRPRRARAEQDAAVALADELLVELKLERLRDHAAGTLSGGQQKLLSLGAALMAGPRVLLLDEPTAGVNPTLRVSLTEHLLAVRERGCTIVVVEHDMTLIGALCDRVYVLDKGAVLGCWAPHELADDPRVVEAYLGTPQPALMKDAS